MNRERKIIIKNPLLKRFRNNLRNFFLEACFIKYEFFQEELKRRGHIGKYKDGLNPTNEERLNIREIRGKMDEIMELMNKSICLCRYCTSQAKDMIFSSARNEWICEDCIGNV